MKKIAVLGSTGSIGVNTLDVVSKNRDKFEVTAITADTNIELLSRQARNFHPKMVCVRDPSIAKDAEKVIRGNIKILCGTEGLDEIVSNSGAELIVFAISGSACLSPLLRAIEEKKKIALANKESLVSGGEIVMKLAAEKKVKIVPIDSEHSAIFQCLEGKEGYLRKIYLTGSGGPLLRIPARRFDKLPHSFILAHPKWKMGRKISVDSATMMNKGLEIIEAKWLFGIEEKLIDVMVHPEAIIHSMIELTDGSVFAQMAMPDMRLPIQYALTYPERFKGISKSVDFPALKKLSFYKPDIKKFPCLELAREAIKCGGTYPAALNAADEEAVKYFLDGKIKFSRIPYIIEKVLNYHKNVTKKELTLDDIFGVEAWARQEAKLLCCR